MRNVVMTGVTSGLGIDWLCELAKYKEDKIFALARNQTKFNEIKKCNYLGENVIFTQCDLSSLSSIMQAVENIERKVDKVHLLINNAGVFAKEKIENSMDNIEMTLAVNQIAPFYLTGKLLPLLRSANTAKIVNTASFRHKDAVIDRGDIELKSGFDPERAYCNSKLYSVLFTKKLVRNLLNSNVSVACFDPGIVDTPMLDLAFPDKMKFALPIFRKLIARSARKGAETGLFLSRPNDENWPDESGQYFKDCRPIMTNSLAVDEELQNWLWAESERLSGISY